MARARPSKTNKATINVKENNLSNTSTNVIEEIDFVEESNIETNKDVTIKTLNRDMVISMNGKSNILAGIKKESVKKIEKRKVNIYLEEDIFNKLLYVAEINNNRYDSNSRIINN